MARDLRAYGLVAMGIVCGLVWGGACGGGSGSSASGQGLPTAQIVTHISTTTGPIAVPPSAGANQLIRSITFTPTNPDDVILYVMVQGTATTNSLGVTTWIEISDATGNMIYREDTQTMFGASLTPYRWLLSLAHDEKGSATSTENLAVPGGLSYSFPSISYTIRFSVDTVGTWVGQFDTVQFKIVTSEGTVVEDPSLNITG